MARVYRDGLGYVSIFEPSEHHGGLVVPAGGSDITAAVPDNYRERIRDCEVIFFGYFSFVFSISTKPSVNLKNNPDFYT